MFGIGLWELLCIVAFLAILGGLVAVILFSARGTRAAKPCPVCGMPVSPPANFCPHCGRPLTEASSPKPQRS
jgi:predicted amidophosphoribosyltransferase